ncbi:hypothetical protein Salat_2068600 [Sesamum alatum]|uniref:Uncharacterized protein n=1 Tax=Sesamum alatum TaxID=300844 RepID=A0AAE1XZY0_9LAMI|nr:hypothetical protein Salat_2068600 [Sesamum alatum]
MILSLFWRNTHGGVFIEKKKSLDEGITSSDIGKRGRRIQGRLRERQGGTIEDERGRDFRVSTNEKSSFIDEEKTGRVSSLWAEGMGQAFQCWPRSFRNIGQKNPQVV